jgi:hypothetical protein
MTEPSDILVDVESIKKRYLLYEPHELKVYSDSLADCGWLIEDLVAQPSLVIAVGRSGEGKSPFLYQLGLSVASGIPFLKRRVKRGRVLYIDYENPVVGVNRLIAQLTRHISTASTIPHFYSWNANDPKRQTIPSRETICSLIRDLRPVLAIIDPISAAFPEIEEKNTHVHPVLIQLREVMAEVGCSIIAVHHLRKPGEAESLLSLESGMGRDWFVQARGPGALINGCDVRLGFDRPKSTGRMNSEDEEIALVVGGFARLQGDLPLIYVARRFDDDERPLGYSSVSSVNLLGNSEQIEAYKKLLRIPAKTNTDSEGNANGIPGRRRTVLGA